MSCARERRRRLLFGLSTLLGLRARGFFIPYRYAGTLPGPGGRAPYAPIESRFGALEARFEEVLTWIDEFADALRAIGTEAPAKPRWGQSWFPCLDAAAAYAMMRRRRPRRLIEVGAGHSTRFLARAVAEGGLSTVITAIDPAPRADLAGLGVTLHRATVQEVPLEVFATLEAGDLLSIDSSHILMPGSDVDLLFNRVLPCLAEGVLLHVHDVFLPDDYPVQWAWRGYNEQLAVAPLFHDAAWQPLFASHYVVTRMAERLAETVVAELFKPAGAMESSLWLEKRGPGHGTLTEN